MQYRLHISNKDLERLYQHAEMSYPNEAVAFLFGNRRQMDLLVSRAVLLQNTSPRSRTSFSVNPEEQYRLYIDAEERNEILVSIFHSHPAPPLPSVRDIDNMRLNPVVWLIASRMTGTWTHKAYVLQAEVPVEIDIIPAP